MILSLSTRLLRGRRRGAATAAVDTSSDDDSDAEREDPGSCYICANDFCEDEECCRSLTHLGCCTQALCCGCLVKNCTQCTCRDDCVEVVSYCPFCRRISPVDTLEVFLGYKKACGPCVKRDEKAADTATSCLRTPAASAPLEPAGSANGAEVA